MFPLPKNSGSVFCLFVIFSPSAARITREKRKQEAAESISLNVKSLARFLLRWFFSRSSWLSMLLRDCHRSLLLSGCANKTILDSSTTKKTFLLCCQLFLSLARPLLTNSQLIFNNFSVSFTGRFDINFSSHPTDTAQHGPTRWIRYQCSPLMKSLQSRNVLSIVTN